MTTEAKKGSVGQSIFASAFLVLTGFLFLTLGSDFESLVVVRAALGTVLIFLFPLFFPEARRVESLKNAALLFFLLFVGFELFRALWFLGRIGGRVPGDEAESLFNRYVFYPLRWPFSLGLFLVSSFLFRSRREASRLLWTLGGSGFFLALNAIPFILFWWRGFGDQGGVVGFFHPLLYSHELLSKYLFGSYANPNTVGDLIALGFFPCLALFIYSFQLLPHFKKKREGGEAVGGEVAFFFLPVLMAAAMALAVVLFFSRATIGSFLIATAVFFLSHLIKFPSRPQLISLGLSFLVVLGILGWAGRLPAVWRELQTVKTELRTKLDPSKPPVTVLINKEAAQRALAMHRDYTFWGVGTWGYAALSDFYASPGTEGEWGQGGAKFDARCHYLEVLAEEGVGSYLYFLFLAAYLLQTAWGLFRSGSRFQFMAGLSLFTGVLMILIHAGIIDMMERLTISVLVYILMGATLGLLSRDFQQA